MRRGSCRLGFARARNHHDRHYRERRNKNERVFHKRGFFVDCTIIGYSMSLVIVFMWFFLWWFSHVQITPCRLLFPVAYTSSLRSGGEVFAVNCPLQFFTSPLGPRTPAASPGNRWTDLVACGLAWLLRS
jgi:hypothetical protein